MSTIADRVWYAIHCLPRDEHGRAPEMRTLEKKIGLSNGVISTTVRGKRRDHTYRTRSKMADVLGVDMNWLETGKGVAPLLTGALPPRPGTESVAAWLPGSGAVPPGTEAIAAWRPDAVDLAKQIQPQHSVSATMDAVGMDVNAKLKATHPKRSACVSRTTDGDVDPCQSRRILIAIARGTRIPSAVIDALLAETVSGDDPGEAYWKRRMYEHLDEFNRIAKYMSAGGLDDRDGGVL